LYGKVGGGVAGTVAAGDRPTVVSADCTTSLGTVAGLQHAGLDPGIVWFDGHGDVQTLETTASGYLGGFPLRILVGYRPELIADALRLRPAPEARAGGGGWSRPPTACSPTRPWSRPPRPPRSWIPTRASRTRPPRWTARGPSWSSGSPRTRT